MKIVQIGDIIAKDDFEKVQKISNQESLTSKRVPPQLKGYIPEAQSHFGDAEKAMKIFGYMEINSLQSDFEKSINEQLEKKHHISFERFEPLGSGEDSTRNLIQRFQFKQNGGFY